MRMRRLGIFREHIEDIVLGHQPPRFIAKSVRNIFFPSKPRIDLRRVITVEVSSICDAKCIFCAYTLDLREKKLASLEWFTSVARSSVALGYKHIDLTSLTGELFTHKNAIEIIRAAKKAGFETVSTYTNGLQLHRFDAEQLLSSGINYLFISTPGFSEELYESVFGVRRYADFKKSITQLLETHKRLRSSVHICFEPRTFLKMKQLQESDFYKSFIAHYINDRVQFNKPLRVFDTWGGTIGVNDMMGGMKIDRNPLKSIAPLKKVHPCERLYQVAVQANGDVRLCNCRYDSTIETEHDSLRIDSLSHHHDLEALMAQNAEKIRLVRTNFVNGKLPELCKKCSFYTPVRADLMNMSERRSQQ
jgi:hypothetical protein